VKSLEKGKKMIFLFFFGWVFVFVCLLDERIIGFFLF